ncbi:hypothetical protein [Burkholderia alba]|uniref:hypothetical protein n=1 Tax=Burkholderia alba TaxID=2683677 RepID=UPI002B05F9C5|nr:hypothetical protein [Burkholderia alba]
MSLSFVLPTRRGRYLLCAAMAMGVAACKAPDPQARVTGDAGPSHLLRLSSKQTTIDLTNAERASLVRVQQRTFASSTPAAAAAAGEVALRALEFEPVTVDAGGSLVEGERNRVVGDRAHEAIRAIFKAKGVPLSARTDHESAHALLLMRPLAGGGVSVWARFTVTQWNTNGDSTTTTVTDPAFYAGFFDRLGLH